MRLRSRAPLQAWCEKRGISEAIVAASTCARAASRWASCARAGSPARTCRSPRRGRLRNTPREAYEVPDPGGRLISTALVFAARG